METHYKRALDKALNWVERNFEVKGIIVSGSIIRGNPDSNSDFDIYVVHKAAFRQRLQKFFEGVPCEIFVNNIKHVYDYFEQELNVNRPVTANMIATGTLFVGSDDPEMITLIAAASNYNLKVPSLDPGKLVAIRYSLATLFEDATDARISDPATSNYFLNKLMLELIDLIFLSNQTPLPRPKERLNLLKKLNLKVGADVERFYCTDNFEQRYCIAERLMSTVIGHVRFFEWESVR